MTVERYEVFHLHTSLGVPMYHVTDLYHEVELPEDTGGVPCTYITHSERIEVDPAAAQQIADALNATAEIPDVDTEHEAPALQVAPQVAPPVADEAPVPAPAAFIDWNEDVADPPESKYIKWDET